jgi:ubiquinone/menaquinone biosynthesis C-methylase UbiE
MPSAEKFWDRIANRYAKSPVKNMDAYNKTLERTRAHLSKDDNVLEVACGTGTTALILADSVKHITAIDISSNMVAIAEGKARDQDAKNVSFVHATLDNDKFDKGPYDAILAFNFLHLLSDLPATIGKVHQLLKPGGLFVSKSLCMGENAKLWLKLLIPFQKLGLIPDFKLLKIDELEGLISQENFEILETGNYPADPPSRLIVAKKL